MVMIYSQATIQRSPLLQRKNKHIRRVTAYIRSLDRDCQFWCDSDCTNHSLNQHFFSALLRKYAQC